MTAPLLTLREAAKAAGLPRNAVWRAARGGHLPTVRLTPRGRHYVRPDDLDTWLAHHRHPARALPSLPPQGPPAPRTLAELMPRVRRFA